MKTCGRSIKFNNNEGKRLIIISSIDFSTIDFSPLAPTIQPLHSTTRETWRRRSEPFEVTQTGWRTSNTANETVCWLRRALMDRYLLGIWTRIPRIIWLIRKFSTRQVSFEVWSSVQWRIEEKLMLDFVDTKVSRDSRVACEMFQLLISY